MTDLGKVFTVIVTILSIVFLVLSMVVNASHVNYAKLATQYEQENARLTQSTQQLKAALEDGKTALSHEQAARRQALASLQSQNITLEGQLASSQAELSKLQSQNTLLNQSLQETQDMLQRTTSENESIRQQLASTMQDRNEVRGRLVEKLDELHNTSSLLQDSREQVKSLQDEVTVLQAKNNAASETLARNGLPAEPEDLPPSDIKGVVTAVSGSDLVEISLGRDDGLRAGHQLEVYRGNQYLGRVRIQKVNDDKSIGEILKSHRRGFIQKGDIVAAKIG